MLSFGGEVPRSNDLEIYWAKTGDYKRSDIESRWLHLLDEGERETYHSYLVESRKLEFFMGRILIKTVMSQFLCCHPEEIIVRKDAYGRPFVEGAGINFNLSHTSGIVACAFSELSVGLDVEKMALPPYEIMYKVFVPSELDFIAKQPTEQSKREAFYSMWTRKEAVLKALGKGFAIPPTTVDVSVDWGENGSGEYQFMSFQFHADYMISFAVKTLKPSLNFLFKEYRLPSYSLYSAIT